MTWMEGSHLLQFHSVILVRHLSGESANDIDSGVGELPTLVEVCPFTTQAGAKQQVLTCRGLIHEFRTPSSCSETSASSNTENNFCHDRAPPGLMFATVLGRRGVLTEPIPSHLLSATNQCSTPASTTNPQVSQRKLNSRRR